MSKPRFRKLKQKQRDSQAESPLSSLRYPYAFASLRFKAVLTDSFMLLMPIMYVVFYLVMGGRAGFADNMLMGWIDIVVPLVVVQTLFLARFGQTPGYRAYGLMLIDEKSGEKPSIGKIAIRNLLSVFSLFLFIGWIMLFFRKDKKTLHDLLTRTAVISKSTSL